MLGFFIPEVRMGVGSEVIWLRVLAQIDREQEALQAQHPDFDTWMRHRINVAHVRYMERTSYRLSCDWHVVPPQAIADFITKYGGTTGER